MNEWTDEWIAAWSLSKSLLYLGSQVNNWLTSNQPMYDRDKIQMVREHNMSRDELFLSLSAFLKYLLYGLCSGKCLKPTTEWLMNKTLISFEKRIAIQIY